MREQQLWVGIVVELAAVALASCATTVATAPPAQPGSRGLRASDHLDAARQQDELARQDLRVPDTHAGDLAPVAMSWTRAWDANVDHERLAATHRSLAAQLQADYDDACRGHDGAEIAVSPLARYAIGGSPTGDGAVFYLSPDAGPPDRLLADLRCHRAWMMLAPSDMDDCPLDLAGIAIDARGDEGAISVTIHVADPALVPELQRRAARELELAEQTHRTP